jgi:hypothetical protein
MSYVYNTFSDSGNRMERFDLSNVKTPKKLRSDIQHSPL